MLPEEEENDGNEVHINRINGDQSWFNPRAKCYPLYSLMLAINRSKIDLLSLGCQGQELDVSIMQQTKSKTEHLIETNFYFFLDPKNNSIQQSIN